MKHPFLAFLIGLSVAGAGSALAAQSAGPSADYTIHPDHTEASPDGATSVEQYARESPDGDYTWQFWARRKDGMTLLKPEQPDYAAGFRFTADSKWLVRMQKTGSGEADMYLYRLGPDGFVSATKKPLSEMAWTYFYSLPASRKVEKPNFHFSAILVKGTEENYHGLGVSWPDNRYLVIALFGDVEPNRKHHQITSVRGWYCRYDLEKGTFDVPETFSKDNAKAIARE